MMHTLAIRISTIVVAAVVAALVVLGALWGMDSVRAEQLMARLAAINTPPTLVSYQGVIEVDGTPVDGTGNFSFSLFNVASGGTALWTETQNGLTITGGLVQTNLGVYAPLTADDFDGSERWLEVTYGSTVLSPRQRITSVPYALRANFADAATSVVTIGDDPAVCNSDTAGVLRFKNEKLFVCDGTDWYMVSTTKVIDTEVVLYHGGTTTGAMGGRSGADALCAAAAERPAGFVNTRAFLSVDASDSIANMPQNFGVPTGLPIKSTYGMPIANHWSDLMIGALASPLEHAGVLPDGYWWSGSNPDGTFRGDSCTGWTSNSTVGYVGRSNNSGPAWISSQSEFCTAGYYLLCLAY